MRNFCKEEIMLYPDMPSLGALLASLSGLSVTPVPPLEWWKVSFKYFLVTQIIAFEVTCKID
jgi:hypothetical protein